MSLRAGVRKELLSAHRQLGGYHTGTDPTNWTPLSNYSCEDGNVDQPPAPFHGADEFSVVGMVHLDGRQVFCSYDLGDCVYVDCGPIHWSGPLEDRVYAEATWNQDYEAARRAYLTEIEGSSTAPLLPRQSDPISIRVYAESMADKFCLPQTIFRNDDTGGWWHTNSLASVLQSSEVYVTVLPERYFR